MQAKRIAALVILVTVLSGCTVNIGSPSGEGLTHEQEDFIACELWFEMIPGVRIDPNQESEETRRSALATLRSRLEKLEGLSSPTAMKVRRLHQQMLEEREYFLETGQQIYLVDLVPDLESTCRDILGVSY